MQFSHTRRDGGGKFGKFTVVAALHVAVGALLIHNLNTRSISVQKIVDSIPVDIRPEPRIPPPPPPEPPQPAQQLAPPQIFVPKIETDVVPPPEPAPMQTTQVAEPLPPPATPVQSAAPTPPVAAARPDADAGRIRTAVLADANSCALPAYPARAVREGASGTTTLALLVGTDGRVSSARVEHGSGSRDLDRAALAALSLCRFKPATSNGVPEAGWAQLAYVWTLD
ncbi:energy transducer TonB [Massilia forsythiae]|uniref:Energy transducer TonB n=1 Tax=Massilia forsythiae TaxID=2728020 RepID=A0A7Z2ZT90_9BURK|nr:energy transducer TonB [Massilia forsythiae]QJD99741.1 energy transducer TonB [Massilia forsythiae]